MVRAFYRIRIYLVATAIVVKRTELLIILSGFTTGILHEKRYLEYRFIPGSLMRQKSVTAFFIVCHPKIARNNQVVFI